MDDESIPKERRLETTDKMEAVQAYVRRAGYNALTESGKRLLGAMTVQQAATLSAVRRLTRHQSGGVLHGALAQEMRLTPSAITRLVDPLVTQGLLRRRQSQHDRRGVLLSLTPEGIKISEQVEQRMLDAANKLSADLTEEERCMFTRIIDKLYAAIDEE